ncbi:MAG: right-handed parallel beta-helix repeat-containing protein, partial [Candidatus Margulisbacteria bacterium]|nr:right-handed parallel beta-helix repeat-containing protein [Candidatus Margulisiibacteriota bacterium]
IVTPCVHDEGVHIIWPNIQNIILRGNGNTPGDVVFSGGNTHRLFYIDKAVSLSIQNLTIANGYEDWGGGVYIAYGSSATLNLISTIVKNNKASDQGGGIYARDSALYAKGSVFQNNNCTYGSAIFMWWGNVNLVNNIFIDNTGSNTILDFANSGTYELYCNTFSNNSGIAISHDGSSATLIGKNNIVWSNSGGISGSWDMTYSDIQGSYSGTGNINIDPKFVNGPTADLRLRMDSPCIDSGSNISTISEDISGNYRPVYSSCDIGAYEYQDLFINECFPERYQYNIKPDIEKISFRIRDNNNLINSSNITCNINGVLFYGASLNIIDNSSTTADLLVSFNYSFNENTHYAVTIDVQGVSQNYSSAYWFETGAYHVFNQTKGMLAYTSIQTALDSASANDVIVVTPCVHDEKSQINWPNKEGLILKGLTVSSDVMLSGGSTHRIIYVGFPVSLSIQEITLTEGKISGEKGGGIYLGTGATLNMYRVSVSNNSTTAVAFTDADGAGIYILGKCVIDTCSFLHNYASSSDHGGAIYNKGECFVCNTIFNNNFGNEGGAINNESTLTVLDCIFQQNTCLGWGGGAIANNGGKLILEKNVF